MSLVYLRYEPLIDKHKLCKYTVFLFCGLYCSPCFLWCAEVCQVIGQCYQEGKPLSQLHVLLPLKLIKRAGRYWCTPLIPALGRQRQADFWVRGQPGLQSEFQDSQGYIEKPCLEKTKNKKQTKNKQTNKQKQNLIKRLTTSTWEYLAKGIETPNVHWHVSRFETWFLHAKELTQLLGNPATGNKQHG
jgi:phenylpyruvate tautomerase PptA (4-oxalocrotonate tautomerase family)